jgi:hypothetical protein
MASDAIRETLLFYKLDDLKKAVKKTVLWGRFAELKGEVDMLTREEFVEHFNKHVSIEEVEKLVAPLEKAKRRGSERKKKQGSTTPMMRGTEQANTPTSSSSSSSSSPKPGEEKGDISHILGT